MSDVPVNKEVDKLQVIRDLKREAGDLEFDQNDKLDSFQRRAEMMLRNLFGAESRWLRDFQSIWLVATGLRTIDGEMDDWARGRAQYVNLFQTIEDELQLFDGDRSDAPTSPKEAGRLGKVIGKDLEGVKRDWQVDFANRSVHRRKFGFLRSLKEILWSTAYPVQALYTLAREQESSTVGMGHPHVFDSDGLEPVSGVPSRFELRPAWDIPQRDLKSLIEGPLTQSGSVLVPASSRHRTRRIAWSVVKVFAALGGAITFIMIVLGWMLKAAEMFGYSGFHLRP